MSTPRTPCCVDPASRKRCGTRWPELRAWVCTVTGKGVQVVDIDADERGRSPFFAQPVGYDGRTFRIADDYGCDTEKLLHEVCHWLLTPRERRGRVNFGLGPGHREKVEDPESDNEEVSVMLLEQLLAPVFALDSGKIARPDYNVANRRNVDWDACRVRAEQAFAAIEASLPVRTLAR